ncbi:MAG: ImmA/IrrE family metallo-endopeptidase [Pyrinomonadaceae bacterium]
MNTVAASIPVLRWAADRSRLTETELQIRFKKWNQWISGEAKPTLRQLEKFAGHTHTPIGFFFLPEPPNLSLPLPDFRTVYGKDQGDPSPELLDMIYICQQRQDWYKEYARLHGLEPLEFVGSVNLDADPKSVASRIRSTLLFSTEERSVLSNWSAALRLLVSRAEDAGILVMASSVVGSNSHRKLDVEEFRGFALADPNAPLVFLNGSDSKSAQMFTLVHELAHLWLGETGVSDTQAGWIPNNKTERWCNAVAAEVLMPMSEISLPRVDRQNLSVEVDRLARAFKVSTLVVLRRLYDAGHIDRETLWKSYRSEQEKIQEILERKGKGGDFYRSLGSRVSKRFCHAVVSSTLEGMTSFSEAFRMLGIRKNSTFYETAKKVGVWQ